MRKPDDSAILLINCPDRKGLAAAIANFLFENGANIKHADQHEDPEEGLFLMRIEWNLEGCDIGFDTFKARFAEVGRRFGMTWRMERARETTKLAIFVSKYDHCLVDLLHRHESGELGCDLRLVVSNHPDNERHASFYGVPFHRVAVPAGDSDGKARAEREQLDLLAKHGVKLVALARYMQILSSDFLTSFGQPIINVHHSFLPAFSGARPYPRAFERGVKLIGATSHYVTEDLDEGPIIEQDVARVSHRDDVQRLIAKGRDLERLVLARAIAWHAEHRVLVYGRKTVIFD